MAVFSLVILGVVQGLCEFLPVSSSGHLVLLSRIFGIEDSLFVSIILHVATLLAVLVVMRKEVFYLIRHPFSKEAIFIYLSTICTCAVAILLMPWITSSFEGYALPFFFLLTAVILLISSKKKSGENNFSYKQAIFVGLAQGLAIFPGLSRSGSTISAGIASGASRKQSSKFSFLVSIPIILGSLLMEVYEIATEGRSLSINPLGMVLSFTLAFIVGILTIRFMLKVTTKSYKWFAVYLIGMAVISAFIVW